RAHHAARVIGAAARLVRDRRRAAGHGRGRPRQPGSQGEGHPRRRRTEHRRHRGGDRPGAGHLAAVRRLLAPRAAGAGDEGTPQVALLRARGFRTPGPAILAVALLLAALPACGGSPAQIVDYSPLRGQQSVPTVEPVRITFDHAVDQASVASRLHLVPSATGSLKWLSDRELEYDHLPLAPSTTYEVVIEAGYRDAAGNVYVLRHHWSFITEPPPAFTAASPADGATGIDPADYLTVDFSRAMDAGSMRSGIVLSPQVAFNVRLDPTDARRAIVAPNSLLAPSTTYTMLITTGVLDQDGNQLDRVQTIQFTTGAVSTLHGWIAFAALRSTGDSAGLWIINDLGFPRLLLDAGSIQSFAWSPDGNSLVYESQAGTWSAYTPGGAPETLDFTASWAA